MESLAGNGSGRLVLLPSPATKYLAARPWRDLGAAPTAWCLFLCPSPENPRPAPDPPCPPPRPRPPPPPPSPHPRPRLAPCCPRPVLASPRVCLAPCLPCLHRERLQAAGCELLVVHVRAHAPHGAEPCRSGCPPRPVPGLPPCRPP